MKLDQSVHISRSLIQMHIIIIYSTHNHSDIKL